MPRIERQSPPRHLLALDTNVLWRHEKEADKLSPALVEFWTEYGRQYDIELIIPEVVRGELLYQYVTSARKALERSNTQFERMSQIADSTYLHRVTGKRLNRDISKRIDKFFAGLNARIVPTPYKIIDWPALVENAIWRRPPFTEDRDREKGFRDSLILETVCNVAANRDATSIAFVTDDELLRSACNSRLSQDSQASCYQSLDEFASTLRLLDEELTQEFVSSIQKRAKDKFFRRGDFSSLFYREKLQSRIKEEFADRFEAPYPSGKTRSIGLLITRPKWTRVSDEKVFVWNPTFQRLEGEHEFFWRSDIRFVQLFQLIGGSTGTVLSGRAVEGQVNIRTLHFAVDWMALVDRLGRFRRVELVDIEQEGRVFEKVTEADTDYYELKLQDEDVSE